jgi:hypothetical protein
MASDGCVVATIRIENSETTKCFFTFLGLVGDNVNPAGTLKRCILAVQDLMRLHHQETLSAPCIQDIYAVLEKQIWDSLRKRPLIQITVIGQDGFLISHDPMNHERQPVYRGKKNYHKKHDTSEHAYHHSDQKPRHAYAQHKHDAHFHKEPLQKHESYSNKEHVSKKK